VPSRGVGAVYLAVAALIGSGLVLLAVAYQPPANSVIIAAASTRIDRTTAIAVIAAGLIWGLFNVGFAIIFSFGPRRRSILAPPRSWPARSCFGRSIAFPQRCRGQRNHDLVQPALTSCSKASEII
jgi:hypothetical protein